jgi:hypothetical protein
MLARVAGAPGRGSRRGLDQRDNDRLLPRAVAKGGGVCERDVFAAAVTVGAASGVSWLDEQALMMIADEVLGGWACSSLGVAARARCSQSVM